MLRLLSTEELERLCRIFLRAPSTAASSLLPSSLLELKTTSGVDCLRLTSRRCGFNRLFLSVARAFLEAVVGVEPFRAWTEEVPLGFDGDEVFDDRVFVTVRCSTGRSTLRITGAEPDWMMLGRLPVVKNDIEMQGCAYASVRLEEIWQLAQR